MKKEKIHNKVRKVRKETLNKLYFNLQKQCRSCCFNANCTEIDKNTSGNCVNYKEAIALNDLIEMMKKSNMDIDSFCVKYGLKKEFFIQMAKGKMLMNYRYYVALCTRLHVEEFDIFYEYEKRFLKDEDETSEEVSE